MQQKQETPMIPNDLTMIFLCKNRSVRFCMVFWMPLEPFENYSQPSETMKKTKGSMGAL